MCDMLGHLCIIKDQYSIVMMTLGDAQEKWAKLKNGDDKVIFNIECFTEGIQYVLQLVRNQ